MHGFLALFTFLMTTAEVT